MTAERGEEQQGSQPAVASPLDSHGVNRRMLIRGAYVAAPVVLTLNSKVAAAWAVASGTIAGKLPNGMDALCLIGDAPPAGPKPGQYYLPPNPEVVFVPNSLTYKVAETGPAPTAEQLCINGGTNVQYKMSGGTWQDGPARFGPGILLSNTAATSFGVIPSITDL